MQRQRLVGRLELARRLTGAGKSHVYNQCKPGGALHAAMIGDKVDLDHKNARLFCAEFGYVEPDMVAERAKASTAARAKVKSEPNYDRTPPKSDILPPSTYSYVPYDDSEDDEDAMDAKAYMDLPLREIVRRYGKQVQFKELVNAYKVLVSTQAAEEKMARDRKEFAHFSHLERLAMHIDGLHKMLLTDVAKNIADTAKTLSAAGASDSEVRHAVTKVLEQVIKMTKAQSERIIRSAKS